MTAISPGTLQALGWTLLHFVWQGAAIAALFAASLMLVRSAHVRYTLGVATLVLMMAAPAITFAWLDRAADSVVQSGVPTIVETPTVAALQEAAASSDRFVHTVVARANRPDLMLWLVQAWFLGVVLLTARTAGGLFWIARIRRYEIEPLSDEIHRRCLAIQQRMGLNRLIRYGQHHGLDAPVVIGWFRPIVVVTTQALTGLTVQQLQAVIAHELAHIRRLDAFINVLQIAAETLLFYHPAVWWVSRKLRIEREVCCDHEALAVCGEPVSYARALALMEEWRAAPAMSMAANGGPLAERVLRLLGLSGPSRRTRVTGVGVSVLCVATALLAGNAFVEAAQTNVASPRVPATPEVAATPEVFPKPAASPRPAITPKPAPAPKAAPAAPSSPAAPPGEGARAQSQPSKQSYVASLAAAGFGNLSADELIAMKVQGITPEYIEGVVANGLHPPVDQLLAMKVHGITPEYIQAVLATGLHPKVEELIEMKLQGVTSEYVRETRKVVIDPAVEELVAMKMHGVTPQFVRELQAAGLDARYGRDFIEAKVQGITPDLVKSAIEHGIGDLQLEQLIELKHADVL